MEGAQYPVQAGTALEYNVAARANTDFITDPGMAILLSIITCGLYNIYWNYKQFEAMNKLLGREEYDELVRMLD